MTTADDIIGPPLPEIISREEAIAKGLARYFTGSPCRKGHLVERQTSSSACLECSRRNVAAYQSRNRDKVDARIRRWQEENSERIKAGKAAWHQRNADKRRAYQRYYTTANRKKVTEAHAAYVEANREKLRAASRARYHADIDKHKAARQKRRALKKSAAGVHTSADIRRIYDAQRGKCACCKTKVGKQYHIDHIQPLSKGGSNWPKNLQLLCPRCNVRKHARDPIEFMQSLGMLL